MTDLRKSAEMALEALECMKGYGNVFLSRSHEQKPYDQLCAAIEALRQALTQPEQEPFEYWNAVEGWVTVDREEVFDGRAKQKMMHAAMKQTSQQYRDDPEVMFAMGWDAGFHSRTTGPKREWVGLTDADKQEAFDETQEASGGFWEFADYLEAKLKEKNT